VPVHCPSGSTASKLFILHMLPDSRTDGGGLTDIRVERFAVFEFHGPLATSNARLQSDVYPGWSRALLACAPAAKAENGADGAAVGRGRRKRPSEKGRRWSSRRRG
jgi:hypothetical protein